MKNSLLFLIVLAVLSVFTQCNNTTTNTARITKDFDESWHFHLGDIQGA